MFRNFSRSTVAALLVGSALVVPFSSSRSRNRVPTHVATRTAPTTAWST